MREFRRGKPEDNQERLRKQYEAECKEATSRGLDTLRATLDRMHDTMPTNNEELSSLLANAWRGLETISLNAHALLPEGDMRQASTNETQLTEPLSERLLLRRTLGFHLSEASPAKSYTDNSQGNRFRCYMLPIDDSIVCFTYSSNSEYTMITADNLRIGSSYDQGESDPILETDRVLNHYVDKIINQEALVAFGASDDTEQHNKIYTVLNQVHAGFVEALNNSLPES